MSGLGVELQRSAHLRVGGAFIVAIDEALVLANHVREVFFICRGDAIEFCRLGHVVIDNVFEVGDMEHCRLIADVARQCQFRQALTGQFGEAG